MGLLHTVSAVAYGNITVDIGDVIKFNGGAGLHPDDKSKYKRAQAYISLHKLNNINGYIVGDVFSYSSEIIDYQTDKIVIKNDDVDATFNIYYDANDNVISATVEGSILRNLDKGAYVLIGEIQFEYQGNLTGVGFIISMDGRFELKEPYIRHKQQHQY